MVDLVRWKPFRSIFDEFFTDFAPMLRRNNDDSDFYPRLDIKETEKELEVTVDLPGMNKKDIEVAIDDGVMTIKGERKFEKKEEKDGYTHCERHWGTFERRIRLPENINDQKLEGEYKDGVLRIKAPKIEVKKTEAKKLQLK